MSRVQRILRARLHYWQRKTRRYLPPGVRAVAGVLLLCGGLLGFLPVLGFWMIPLGIAVLATDVPPLNRWLRRRWRLH